MATTKRSGTSRKKPRRRPINQDDLFSVRYVADAVLSPDGAQTAYVLSETHGKGNEETQSLSIWLTATDGSGKSRRLTRGKHSCYHPRFSVDGSELLYLSTRAGAPQIYAMPLDGGDSEQLTELPQGAGPFEIAPDGKTIAFAALARPRPEEDVNQHMRIDRFWYRFDPLGEYLANTEQVVYTLKRGRQPKAVTDPGGIVLSASFSPDSKHLAVVTTGLREHKIFQADLVVIPLGRDKPVRTLVKDTYLSSAVWSSDGRALICTGSGADLARQGSLMLVDADTGRITDRTRSLDLMIGTGLQIHVPVRIPTRIIPSPDGRSVFTTVTRGGEAHVNRISLSGHKQAVAIGSGQCARHLLAKSGNRMLVISQSANEPPTLFSLDETSGETRQLTHHNEAWQAKYQWPDVERLVVKRGGVEVEGWVLKPRHVRAPYRTILTIHGGPHAGYGCGFWGDFHELVGAGYAVAFMNPRGSTGYGDAFCRSILGDWGHPELKDFSAFLDRLVARGISHPEKLGVTGISGGGHLSGWLIGHTHRFKAAVPEQGVYSMISMWGTSDAGRDLLELEMGGELHKIPETYWALSPVAHAHKSRTPTLLLQGENDIRCPMEQAEQMFAQLHHHGCEVEMIPMKRCSHGEQIFGRPALRRYRMNVLKDWFDRHLG